MQFMQATIKGKVCQGNSKDALYVSKHYTTGFSHIQMYLCSYDDQNQANGVSKFGTADCLVVQSSFDEQEVSIQIIPECFPSLQQQL